MKKKILIMISRYSPGHKEGGPIRSMINLTNEFSDAYDFYILTHDRDHGDIFPYENIKVGAWNTFGNVNVYYANYKDFNHHLIRRLSLDKDIIYLCGPYYHYTRITLLLKVLGVIKKPIVIASMGSFSRGALQLKKWKKMTYLALTRFFGFYRNIYWSVSSEFEHQDLNRVFGEKTSQVYVAEDLPRKYLQEPLFPRKPKGTIHIIFISRISRIKNLDYVIDIVSQLRGDIKFSIYGYIEDQKYWSSCLKKLVAFPHNVTWSVHGEVSTEDVLKVFEQSDVFLFPTMSENYGHVIYESMASATVPIISDQTPWKDFNQLECGSVIPLHDKEQFINVCQTFIDMDEMTFDAWRKRAYQYAIKKYNHSISKSGYPIIFEAIK